LQATLFVLIDAIERICMPDSSNRINTGELVFVRQMARLPAKLLFYAIVLRRVNSQFRIVKFSFPMPSIM